MFAYHGAEHMTIHAFEHRVAARARPASAQFDRRHPRCGTAFLLVVVLVTMFAHALVGHPSWGLLVASRILGLPIVAGVAYEAIRFAGRHQHQLVGRILMAPGSWLQAITTAEPDRRHDRGGRRRPRGHPRRRAARPPPPTAAARRRGRWRP